jgi:hypothetical protein
MACGIVAVFGCLQVFEVFVHVPAAEIFDLAT